MVTGWEVSRGIGGSITSARVIPDLHVNLQPFPCAMDLVVWLGEAVVRAVCSKDYEHLPRLLRLLSKLNPTEEILVGSGIGHLVSDRNLWGLAGFTVQQRAAVLLARWRLAIRQHRAGPGKPRRVLPKPLGAMAPKCSWPMLQILRSALQHVLLRRRLHFVVQLLQKLC